MIMPKKGIRISDVNMNDISSVFEMRCMVEPYVIRMYGNRLDKEKLREYKKKFETDITPGESYGCGERKTIDESLLWMMNSINILLGTVLIHICGCRWS